MNRIAPIALLFLIATTSIARADSVEARFEGALSSIAAHHPEEAARELRRIVSLGVEDPDVYRNLGIAEAESMRYGYAMVAFERAISLRPGDEVARRGLENATTLLARRMSERTGARAEITQPGALESFSRSIPEPIAAYGALAMMWLACLAAILARMTSRETVRIAALSVTALGTIGLLGFGVATLGRARLGETIAPAIVVRDQARLMSAPDESSPTVSTLDEGDRVVLVERHGAFARIEVAGRSSGWVKRNAIGTY